MTFAVFGRPGGNAQVAAHVDGRILQRDGEEEMDHEYSTVVILAGLPAFGVRRLAAAFSLRKAAASRRTPKAKPSPQRPASENARNDPSLRGTSPVLRESSSPSAPSS